MSEIRPYGKGEYVTEMLDMEPHRITHIKGDPGGQTFTIRDTGGNERDVPEWVLRPWPGEQPADSLIPLNGSQAEPARPVSRGGRHRRHRSLFRRERV